MYRIFLILFLLLLFIRKKYYAMCKKSFIGKHVCVTGGSSGIGKSVAILTAQKGAHVTIIARNKERLEEALAEIEKHRINDEQIIQYKSLDCCCYEDVQKTINELDAELPIYMFVNCAGMAISKEFVKCTKEDIDSMINVNYYATVYPLKAIVPLMKKRRRGVIVITSSQGGLCGIYGFTAYAASKFALRGFAEALHMELRDDNITVTVAVPPDTDTPGFDTENKTKPRATRLISESAGLYKPDEVAARMIKDATNGQFFSYIGLESWLLTTLCIGMSPFQNYFDALTESLLMGVMRAISCCYIVSFHRIVTKCRRKAKKVT